MLSHMNTQTHDPLSLVPPHPMPPDRLTRAEAIERLGVSKTTLARYVVDGTLPIIRASVGRRVWFLASEVERVRRARLGLDGGRDA
jgi:excisionase family DNA binding protein